MKKIYTKIIDNYYIVYSLIFVVLSALCFFYFLIYDKSLISTGDGIQQHYNAVMYLGEYLRTILRNIFENRSIVIPTWDYSLGMGADIFTTLHYYAFGDPLNLLYVFVPKVYCEYLYDLLFFVRLYLAGVTFSMYVRRFNNNNFNILCGAIVYLFCSYTFLIPVIHPYFLNPMIYFPMLCLGIEKIYSKESPILFIVSVFVSAISNFYFLYMLSVLMFIYAVVRFFSYFKTDYIKQIFTELRKFIIYYFVGILGAGVLLLPVIMTTLNTGRAQDKPGISLLYELDYYKELFVTFLTSDTPGYYTLMGFGCIPLVILFLLFVKHKKHVELKIGIAISGLFVLFPIFGSLLNGFSYVTNRWIFALSFLIGIVVTLMMDELRCITKKEYALLVIISVIYLCVLMGINRGINSNGIVVAGVMIVFLLFVGGFVLRLFTWEIMQGIILAGLCFNICVNAYFVYDPSEGDYMSLFIRSGGALASIEESAGNVVPQEEEFYRYGETNNQHSIIYNSTTLNRKRSTSAYWSLIAEPVTSFSKEILSVTERAETKYAGFDDRTIPQALAATKYFVVEEGKEQYLPFGYTKKVNSYKTKDKQGKSYKRTFISYENEYVLPLGYTYDSYISDEDWINYNFIEKEEAMLQTCYIEGAENIDMQKKRDLVFLNSKRVYEIGDSEGVEFKDGLILVTERNGTLEINFEGDNESETYLSFANLQYKCLDNEEAMPADALITVSMNERIKKVRLYTEKHNWYNGIRDFAVNLGYEKTAPKKIVLTFPRVGRYSFDEMSLYTLPFDESYINSIGNLKEESLENVSITNKSLTANITVSDNKILCISLPFGKGWTAFVDGKEVDILRANVMYMGIPVTVGTHTIKLEYSSPFLKFGIVCSCLGMVLFLLIVCFDRKNAKIKEL